MTRRMAGLYVMLTALLVLTTGRTVLAQSGLTTSLTGAAEVGGGDPDGSGNATVTVTSDTTLSYTIDVTGITLPATAAHIHKGAAGANGPVVVPFSPAPGADGKATGTATADAALIADIRANPQNYYVNVHTSDFPNGAMRGQLGGTGTVSAPSAPSTPPTLPKTGSDDALPMQLAVLALTLLAIGLMLTHRRVRS